MGKRTVARAGGEQVVGLDFLVAVQVGTTLPWRQILAGAKETFPLLIHSLLFAGVFLGDWWCENEWPAARVVRGLVEEKDVRVLCVVGFG